MKKVRNILTIILYSSLPVLGFNSTLALASDVKSVYKDSESNTLVTQEKIEVITGGKMQITTTQSNSQQENAVAFKPIICDIRTNEIIKLNPKNYRWHDEDVKGQFSDPDFKGHRLLYAKLCLKYTDVDLTSTNGFTPELNVVQFGDTTIGVLPGNDNQTLTKCWDVTKRVKSNLASSIPFYVNVDAAHDTNHWAVYLDNAKVSTCHARQFQNPPFPIKLLPIDTR